MSGDDGLREALTRTRVELAVALDEVAALRAKVAAADRVRELHTQTTARVKGGEWICCGHDRVTWPCPTICALDESC